MSSSQPTAGPSGLALPVTALSRSIDRLLTLVGELASGLWTVLVAVIVLQVIARYAFGMGSIVMEELQWHLYAVGFILGLGFTEMRERNVRIDVLAERFTQRQRLYIEIFGLVVLLLSVCLMVIWFAAPYTATSFALSETSAAPGGLPYRWVLKSFIVTGFVLLALAGLARLSRVWAALRAS